MSHGSKFWGDADFWAETGRFGRTGEYLIRKNGTGHIEALKGTASTRYEIECGALDDQSVPRCRLSVRVGSNGSPRWQPAIFQLSLGSNYAFSMDNGHDESGKLYQVVPVRGEVMAFGFGQSYDEDMLARLAKAFEADGTLLIERFDEPVYSASNLGPESSMLTLNLVDFADAVDFLKVLVDRTEVSPGE